MKVLLLEDVYNLGRAGEVKKVANGYGRNFLLPQGLAVLATAGALKESERITEEANKKRSLLNEEMAVVAEKLTGLQLLFPAKAGETGKLYGSVTTQTLAEEITEKTGVDISKRQIDSQPLRLLGMHTIKVRLTIDLIPEVEVVIYREGEKAENYMVAAENLFDEDEAYVEIEDDAEAFENPEVAVMPEVDDEPDALTDEAEEPAE